MGQTEGPGLGAGRGRLGPSAKDKGRFWSQHSAPLSFTPGTLGRNPRHQIRLL